MRKWLNMRTNESDYSADPEDDDDDESDSDNEGESWVIGCVCSF